MIARKDSKDVHRLKKTSMTDPELKLGLKVACRSTPLQIQKSKKEQLFKDYQTLYLKEQISSTIFSQPTLSYNNIT